MWRGEYERELRRPRPGSERIILLANPSQVQASVLRDRALEWYERGNLATAIEAFRDSRNAQLHTPQLDDLGLHLARAQEAWMALDFEKLAQRATALRECIDRPNVRDFAATVGVRGHVDALQAVAAGDELAFLATLRCLTARYAAQGRYDIACLLAYRTLEEHVRLGLVRVGRRVAAQRAAAEARVDAAPAPDFDLGAPDLELLTDDPTSVMDRFSHLWSKVIGGASRPAPAQDHVDCRARAPLRGG